MGPASHKFTNSSRSYGTRILKITNKEGSQADERWKGAKVYKNGVRPRFGFMNGQGIQI
jgi:hypothetical protein